MTHSGNETNILQFVHIWSGSSQVRQSESNDFRLSTLSMNNYEDLGEIKTSFKTTKQCASRTCWHPFHLPVCLLTLKHRCNKSFWRSCFWREKLAFCSIVAEERPKNHLAVDQAKVPPRHAQSMTQQVLNSEEICPRRNKKAMRRDHYSKLHRLVLDFWL